MVFASRSKPRASVRVGADVGRQDLDGDRAIEARVAGLVDLPHAACADGGWISYGPRRVPDARVIESPSLTAITRPAS